MTNVYYLVIRLSMNAKGCPRCKKIIHAHTKEILSTFCPHVARHSYSYEYERPVAVITNMQSVVMKR